MLRLKIKINIFEKMQTFFYNLLEFIKKAFHLYNLYIFRIKK